MFHIPGADPGLPGGPKLAVRAQGFGSVTVSREISQIRVHESCVAAVG